MQMEARFRTTFVNSLSGFKGLALIGTKGTTGQTNLAVFNSLVHLGASPPLIGCVVRPDSVERHTLENILNTGQYTINHVHAGLYEKAHQTSARYPASTSEFEATGLEPEYQPGCMAPFVKQSVVKMGVQLKEKILIKSNNTILLVGEIQLVSFPEDCLGPDGYLNHEKAGTLCGSGLDGYHSTRLLARLTYAKPNTRPQML